MDRKLFLSYIQNMQQNNQDLTGFQNSIRKNSWQKPRSIHEMNGGDHAKSIRSDLKDLAAKAYGEFLDNDGTGHPKDTFGKAESYDYLSQHPAWRNLSDSAKDDIHRDFIAHLGDIHDSHMDSTIEQHGPNQDEMDMYTDALQKQGRFLPKMP